MTSLQRVRDRIKHGARQDKGTWGEQAYQYKEDIIRSSEVDVTIRRDLDYCVGPAGWIELDDIVRKDELPGYKAVIYVEDYIEDNILNRGIDSISFDFEYRSRGEEETLKLEGRDPILGQYTVTFEY